MWLGLRTVVETEHTFNNSRKIGWYADYTGTTPVRASCMLELLQCDAEGAIKRGHGARQHHGATFGARFDHDQVMRRGEFNDLRDVLGVGAVKCGIVFSAEVTALLRRLVVECGPVV